MCFKSRKTDEEGLNRSRELDKVIRQDEKRLAREVKLLLLGTRPHGRALSRIYVLHRMLTPGGLFAPTGAGESGKSTVLKQMKLIYAQGFTKNERLEGKPVVFNNVVHSMRTIFDVMSDQGIEFENKENEVRSLCHAAALPPSASRLAPLRTSKV